MEPVQHLLLYLKKRKLLLLGLLLVVGLSGAIYFLSGYRQPATVKTSRLNTRLPDAQFKKAKEKSKMTLYEEMSRDSAAILEKMQHDPFYLINRHDSEVSADQVMEKLERIKTIIHQKAAEPPNELKPEVTTPPKPEFENRKISHETTPHPDLEQLSGMLDKVMAIQHPEILRDSLARLAEEHKPFSYPVELNKKSNEPTSFGKEKISASRFYDLAETSPSEKETEHSIQAEVPESQTLVSGSTIKLRLLNEVQINGKPVLKDQFIYGTVRLAGERLQIQFSSIRSGNQIFPVSLEAYDLDGLAGVYIPGSMEREVVKESGDQMISSIGLNALDPSIGAQAAGAGIQAAKSLITHRVKRIRVTLPEGYQLLLKESKK